MSLQLLNIFRILEHWKEIFFFIILVIVFIRYIRNSMLVNRVIGQSQVWLESGSFMTDEFYKTFEEKLSKYDVSFKSSRVTLSEFSVASAQRVYLKIRWEDTMYYICAAPFGKTFFFSWWKIEPFKIFQIIIKSLPFGGYLVALANEETLYRADITLTFNQMVTKSFQEAIEEIAEQKGIRVPHAPKTTIEQVLA